MGGIDLEMVTFIIEVTLSAIVAVMFMVTLIKVCAKTNLKAISFICVLFIIA
jgi:hypothetical protein